MVTHDNPTAIRHTQGSDRLQVGGLECEGLLLADLHEVPAAALVEPAQVREGVLVGLCGARTHLARCD